MLICIPTTPAGAVDPRWGRAARVALAEIADGQVTSWREVDVAWDRLHDESGEGSHHARIARFLRDEHAQVVAAGHMGEPMVQMLGRMGIRVVLGVGGDARAAAVTAAVVADAGPTTAPETRETPDS